MLGTSLDNAWLVPGNDIAFDAASQPIRADDQPAIMRHSEFAGPHLAGMPVHLDLGDDPMTAPERCA
jgi:hypothetical protein